MSYNYSREELEKYQKWKAQVSLSLPKEILKWLNELSGKGSRSELVCSIIVDEMLRRQGEPPACAECKRIEPLLAEIMEGE